MARPLRWATLLGSCAVILVPALLSAIGVLPDFYTYPDGRMVVESGMINLRAGVAEISLYVASVATVLIAALVTWRIADRLDRALAQVYLQSWQLRQLAPGAESQPRQLPAG